MPPISPDWPGRVSGSFEPGLHPHRARQGGRRRARILFKHALRGGILPVVSFLGPAMAGLLTGSFVVETIFGIPGLGRYFVTAAFNRDYFMVMGSVLFYAVLVIGHESGRRCRPGVVESQIAI